MKKIEHTIIIILFFMIAIYVYFSFWDVMFNDNYQFTWNVITLTWDLNESSLTWLTSTSWELVEISNINLYKEYVKNWHVITFTPTQQPSGKSVTYEWNTTVLNQYLAKHTNYINISKVPWLKNWWFLYVRTKENPIEWIFMYWHNAYWKCWNPVSWKLIQSEEYKISDTEFLYPLNEIELIAYYSKKNCIFDWQQQINERKNQYIWWYVATTNWNTIEEISIAWK